MLKWFPSLFPVGILPVCLWGMGKCDITKLLLTFLGGIMILQFCLLSYLLEVSSEMSQMNSLWLAFKMALGSVWWWWGKERYRTQLAVGCDSHWGWQMCCYGHCNCALLLSVTFDLENSRHVSACHFPVCLWWLR